MANQVTKRSATLSASQPVPIGSSVVLPAGRYTALEKRLGVAGLNGQITWMAPEYFIAFGADEMRSMGAVVPPHHQGATYDVTRFVQSGQLAVV